MSLQLGGKEHHKVTPHNNPHTRDLLGKTQMPGCLFSEEKQQRTKEEAGFLYRVSWGWGFPGLSEIGVLWPDRGARSEVSGFQAQGLVGFCGLILGFFSL